MPDTAPPVPGADRPDRATAPLRTLKKRADFLKASRARRQAAPGLLLQARRRQPDEGGQGIRLGFTCSRKVGNAVARNRAKRRLRAAARAVLAGAGRPGWDYVLVGRAGVTASRPWPDLLADLTRALSAIHADRRKP